MYAAPEAPKAKPTDAPSRGREPATKPAVLPKKAVPTLRPVSGQRRKKLVDVTDVSRWRLLVEPRIALSAEESFPSGGGLALQSFYQMIPRVGVGGGVQWSQHEGVHMVRVGVGLSAFLDLTPILPFVESSLGVQGRFGVGGSAWTIDVQVGAGIAVPIQSHFLAGLSFFMGFPLDVTRFPINRSLHLKLGWVF